MNQVGLWIEIPLKPGTRAAAVAVAEFALERVRADDGALLYLVSGSDSDPDILLLFELYRDQAAMDAHNAAEWLPDYVAKFGEFIGGQPTVHTVRPLLAKGV